MKTPDLPRGKMIRAWSREKHPASEPAQVRRSDSVRALRCPPPGSPRNLPAAGGGGWALRRQKTPHVEDALDHRDPGEKREEPNGWSQHPRAQEQPEDGQHDAFGALEYTDLA